MTQRAKADELRRLHEAPELLVLPNVWDAASARAVEEGAVGCNLEDANGDPAAHAGQVDDAVARGRAYLEAGGDCVFVPGAHKPDDVRALGAAFGGRLSLLAWPGWEAGPLSQLASLGVTRVTVGPGLMGAAYGALSEAAAALLGGELPDAMNVRPPA